MNKLVSMAALAVAALLASQLAAQASRGDAKQLAQAAKASQGDYVKIASACSAAGDGGGCGCSAAE